MGIADMSELSVAFMKNYKELDYAKKEFLKERDCYLDKIHEFLKNVLLMTGIEKKSLKDYDFPRLKLNDVEGYERGFKIIRKYGKIIRHEVASGVGLAINPEVDADKGTWKCGFNPYLFFRKSSQLSGIERIGRHATRDGFQLIEDGGYFCLVKHLPVGKNMTIENCMKIVKDYPRLFIKYDDLISKQCG